jgi:alpha-galactosidase
MHAQGLRLERREASPDSPVHMTFALLHLSNVAFRHAFSSSARFPDDAILVVQLPQGAAGKIQRAKIRDEIALKKGNQKPFLSA